ncbi:carbonic anhydrase [Sphingomonas sp. TDK1]|jgi:carbonic anhydrase|uniref:carbonic anhydrase n=1 Tax=Sphingomonas sp. TDK1 TaxID=453247 RepID=UPI0007D8DBC2|nr:carbonic anhydrase [Sphingomonas sp. TDK1]OAN64881.1 carbonic anhydrase [Sphingomonas sp. TDK1]
MCDAHPSRRALVTGALTATALAAAPAAAQGTGRRGAMRVVPPAPTRNGKSALNPDQALQLLRDGNAAFLRGEVINPDLSPQRRLELARGQAPFVAYVSCSDSRVPPELLFGRGLGELFIVRNAGNTVDTVARGSIEFAVAVLGVPLVVVMGHEACGAVKAAMDVVGKNARFPGAIDSMIEPIIPAVLEARGAAGDPTEAAIRQNVRRVVNNMRERSDPLLMQPQAEGKLKVVGAYYELGTGRVDFFDLPR